MAIGDAFLRPAPVEPSAVERSILAGLSRIFDVLAELGERLANLPAPQVRVERQELDISRIVEAVNSLNGSMYAPSADEIAAAIATVIRPPEPQVVSHDEELIKEIKKLGEAWRQIPRFGSGGTMTLVDQVDREVGRVTVKDTGAIADVKNLLTDVKRSITDTETRLDYDGRSDANPVYVGKNLNGTATSAASWTVQKLSYDGNNRLTRAQVLGGSWDNRASLGW